MKEFIHRPYQKGETIAAVATPPGEGGIAVIRISGKEAIAVAGAMFSGDVASFKSHTLHFGKVLAADNTCIDEALLAVMRAPRSFTGEETVEIHCHGGRLITKRVLERALEAGARAALPGEFSFQAFQNAKLDLAQAEAIQEVIGAKNTLALRLAENQLEGRLSQKIVHFQKELTSVAAILEAWVDFPEEGLEFASQEEVVGSLKTTLDEIENLIATYTSGKVAHDGLTLCLAGPPNAGKSSLMNRLLGKERAIVTEIAGTTRDLLEDDLLLGELSFRLIDTAGIRTSDERIEQEGIRRSKKAMEEADLTLLVVDASIPLDSEAKDLIDAANPEKTLLVWNKIDRAQGAALPALLPFTVMLSAKTGDGVPSLEHALEALIWKHGTPSKEEIVLSSARHHKALKEAAQAIGAVIAGLQAETSPEFLSSDMRTALTELGAIIGANITEDILSSIFSKFCIGK